MPDAPDLVPIGRFAAASRLSLKALRIYDRLGLLRPAHVDAESGYRYYRADQLRAARLVALLRRLDMPLDVIRNVVEAPTSAGAYGVIETYWSEVESRVVQGRRVMAYLRALIQGGGEMALKVKTRQTPAGQAVGIMQDVYVKDLDPFINEAFARLFRYVAAHDIPVAGPGMVIYHGEVNDDSNGPVEVCLPVERGSLEPSGDIGLIDLPAGTEAYTTVTREQTHFPEILGAYDALHTWIKHHNRKTAASPREIYFADESQAGPNDPFCDVAWPYT
ncbi:MAG TPA: MerR family transcriptional regulator [bacterium]|jgi:DNA-binding transcriptional MerR regulator